MSITKKMEKTSKSQQRLEKKKNENKWNKWFNKGLSMFPLWIVILAVKSL